MNMAKFNSDRTIDEYAREIWRVEPFEVTKLNLIENK